jgi:hypothetical protein
MVICILFTKETPCATVHHEILKIALLSSLSLRDLQNLPIVLDGLGLSW